VDFCLPSDRGGELCITSLKGKWVVVYFYPKDNTPGCTVEGREFTSLLPAFEELGAVVVGVSKDSCESHRRFRERHGLKHILLCDEGAKVAKALGFWGKKAFGREGVVRSTILLDPEGKVARVWKNVRARGHAEKVLEELKRLREGK